MSPQSTSTPSESLPPDPASSRSDATPAFLGGAHESHESYRTLATALGQSTMAEMQRRGVLPVFRDGFANFIPLEQDFATREGVLGEVYDAALHALDTAGYGPVVGAVHLQARSARG